MRFSFQRARVLLSVVLSVVATAIAPGTIAADAATKLRTPIQQRYATPDAAVEALVTALRSNDPKRIRAVLGPGSDDLISSGDPVADRNGRARFVAAFEQQSKIEREGDNKATLMVGEKDWPLPFPLLRQADGWRFDAQSGAEEMLNRRIGRNELAAIQVCLAYVDAQREYALTQGNRDGMHEYAMRLVSKPDKKDGLYWPTKEGQPLSPLGPLAEKASKEGYGKGKNAGHEPYHGYLYKILTGQGTHAASGAYAYVTHGRMIGGFALVAYPARWGVSGVMTFVVNHEGVVYEKNFGKATAAIASAMTRFDPDSTWSKAPQ